MILYVLFSFCNSYAQPVVLSPWDVSEKYLENFKIIINSAIDNDFNTAYYYARKLDKTAIALLYWIKLYNNCSSYNEINAFMRKHPDWPRPMNQFQESKVNIVYSIKDVNYWCNGKKKKSVFLNYHVLDQTSISTVVDNLLWDKKVDQAKQMLNYLSDVDLETAKIRIALQKNLKNANEYVNVIPEKYNSDFSVMHDYILWYGRKYSADDNIVNLISSLPYEYKYRDKLWNIYKFHIREILYKKRSKYYKFAYKLSRNCRDTKASSITESYWLSGWIALEFLKNQKAAYRHFTTLYKMVSKPISLSRAAYWSARAAEADGRIGMAFRWYKIASLYKTTFYGQLSLFKTGINQINLNYHTQYSAHDYLRCKNNIFAKIAYLVSKCQNTIISDIFMDHAIRVAKSIGEIGIITELSLENGTPFAAIRGAKIIEPYGMIIPRSLYPIHYNLEKIDTSPEVVLSIIRQESRFNKSAKSHVGAVGLMQLMPYTAKEVAKKLGVKYIEDNLAEPDYNIKLGHIYLKEVLKGYNNSLILSLAAYNAGPGNVNKWIKTIGDPKTITSIEELVNWIEMIPFNETRNYVQRVIENLQIYRGLLKGNQSDNKSIMAYLEKDLIR